MRIFNFHIIRHSEMEKIKARERLLKIRFTDRQIEQILAGEIHLRRNPKRKAA